MKKIIYIISICMVLTSSFSCTKWLDVQPKAVIKSEVTFESVGGFKDALIGIYLLMTNEDIYGKEMSFGFVEAIGQQFSVDGVSSHYYNATRYNYSNTQATVDNYWAKAYYIIVNINNLLENLDKKKDIFTPAMYSVIKGEALGLRAYLHFDLLRAFGWGDLKQKSANMDKLCILYMTKYDKSPAKQLTVGEVLDCLEKDLLESKQLLNDYGPYGLSPRGDDYFLPNDDKYFDDRGKRFNFWASVATLARVYMWKGDYEKAYSEVDLYITKGSGRNAWITSYNIDNYYDYNRDLIFSTELIFGLEISGENDLFKRFKIYMDPKLNDPNRNSQLMFHTQARAKSLYEFSTCGATDFRYKRHYNTVNQYFDGWALNKYWEVTSYRYGKQMAMIRKSEMYYMAAECLLSFGDSYSRAKAVEYMNLVRKNRGISNAYDLNVSMTDTQIKNEITKEWQKEFLSEGQMFYYYKRLGFAKIPNSNTNMTDAVYVLPLPKEDVNLGGLENYK